MDTERENNTQSVEDSYLLILNSLFDITIESPLSSLTDLINPSLLYSILLEMYSIIYNNIVSQI